MKTTTFLSHPENERPSYSLIGHLKYAQTLATVFGYGTISPSKSFILKFLYILYSIFAMSIIIFLLIRLLLEMNWKSDFDLPKAAIVMSIIWLVQSLFSALFFIYATRSGNLQNLKRRWLEMGTDELISDTAFPRVKRRWLIPVIIFFLIVLASEIVELLLEFHGLTLESITSKKPFIIHLWQLCLLLPATGFCIMAWAIPIYTFYVVCTSLSYAWRGFAQKLTKFSERKGSRFGDETLHFVADTHVQLCQLTDLVSVTYGPYALIMIMLAVPDLFLQLFFAASMPADGFLKAQCITWLVISFISVFILFSACAVHTSASSVADVFYNHYYIEWRKQNEEISEKSLLQTSILLTKLYNSSIHISACGWFSVSKSTLGGIISILITGYYLFLLGGEAAVQHCGLANATVANNVSVVSAM